MVTGNYFNRLLDRHRSGYTDSDALIFLRMFIDTYNLGKTAKDTLWKQIPDCTAPPEILFCISTENKEIDLNALKELKDALSDLLFDVSPLSDYIEKSKSRRLVLSLGVKGGSVKWIEEEKRIHCTTHEGQEIIIEVKNSQIVLKIGDDSFILCRLIQ